MLQLYFKNDDGKLSIDKNTKIVVENLLAKPTIAYCLNAKPNSSILTKVARFGANKVSQKLLRSYH